MIDLKFRPRAVLAALTGLALASGGSAAQAQEHPAQAAPDYAVMSDADMGQLQSQVAALFAIMLADADYDTVETYLTELIRAHPDAIGGDTDAFVAHVSELVEHVSQASDEDPHAVADHVASVLMQLHSPQH